MHLSAGSAVRLVTPDNPRLHGSTAKVTALQEWGAHVAVKAAATGRFRAGWDEMVPAEDVNGGGYTGDVCNACGSLRMRHNGNCLLCDDCGATNGCS